MKIAVTTAGGGLGSAIIKRLKQEISHKNLIGIARTPQKAQSLNLEIRKGDYNNKEDFMTALRGIDTVVLVSGMDHPEKRIQQHRNVIESAKENGVKKIVYTSITGSPEGNDFSLVVASNRQTEEDIRNSGLQWAIGRNGIYIEPDLQYFENYKKEGGIINSAGDGKCGYTSRPELACAYFKMINDETLNGKIYNLLGNPITQLQLAEAFNKVYNTRLFYKSISIEEYTQQRKDALGEFLGTVIGGIYEGIRKGKFDAKSDFSAVTGRAHKSAVEMIREYSNL